MVVVLGDLFTAFGFKHATRPFAFRFPCFGFRLDFEFFAFFLVHSIVCVDG